MTTTFAAAMFVAVFSAGPASQSEALTRARVNAYLGSEKTTAEEWRQLDATAVPFLTKVIGDLDESPARRVRAITALSLLGSRSDLRQLMEVARAKKDDTAVRLVALRYAVPSFSRAEATAQLRPFLKDSQLRIRVNAAELLTSVSQTAGCVSVRAQVAREKRRDQQSYHRALAHCRPSPNEPATAEDEEDSQ